MWGVRLIWDEKGGKLNADAARWRALIEPKSLTREASWRGRGEFLTQLQDWEISNPVDRGREYQDFTNNVLKETGRRLPAQKVSVAVRGADTQESDMRKREIAVGHLNPQSAFQKADMITVSSAKSPNLGEASKNLVPTVGFDPDEVSSGAPCNKTAKGACGATFVGGIRKFEARNGRLKMLRSRALGLKCVPRA